MGFMDSYKHLEKLCGEVFDDERKVSAYIDNMLSKPRGSYLVRGWNEDLKQLKHYRWVRNQIVHEPGCSEKNMCEPEDADWIDDFYLRIMNKTDPLALYHKATRHSHTAKPPQVHKKIRQSYTYHTQTTRTKKSSGKLAGYIFALFFVVIAFIAIFLVLSSI